MNPIHISIRNLLTTYGDDFCTDRQFVNYLSDYSQFDPPALKAIISVIVRDGYAQKLVEAKQGNGNWSMVVSESIPKIVKLNGFEDSYVSFCFQCICYGLQLTNNIDESILTENMAGGATTKRSSAKSTSELTQWFSNTTKSKQTPPRVRFQAGPHAKGNPTKSTRSATASSIHNKKPFKGIIILAVAFGIIALIAVLASVIQDRGTERKSSALYNNTYHDDDIDLKNEDLDLGPILNDLDSLTDHNLEESDSDYNSTSIETEVQRRQAEIEAEVQRRQAELEAELQRRQAELEAEMQRNLAELEARNSRQQAERGQSSTNSSSSDQYDSPTQDDDQSPEEDDNGKESFKNKAKRYYKKAKEKVLETLDMDEQEVKDKWHNTKESVKEKWREFKNRF